MNSLGSLASLGSLGPLSSLSLGLVCAATIVSGSVIPIQDQSVRTPDAQYRGVDIDKWMKSNRKDDGMIRNSAREPGPPAGERTDTYPFKGGPKKGDGRADGSLPKGPDSSKAGKDSDVPGMKSPGEVITACTTPGTAALTFVRSSCSCLCFHLPGPLLIFSSCDFAGRWTLYIYVSDLVLVRI